VLSDALLEMVRLGDPTCRQSDPAAPCSRSCDSLRVQIKSLPLIFNPSALISLPRLFAVQIAYYAKLVLVNMEVPTASSLRDIYPEDALPVETKRWNSLLAKFKDLYGKQADFVARSPGRVNIIGEVNMVSIRHVTGDLRYTAH
jgi:hypothetical protein